MRLLPAILVFSLCVAAAVRAEPPAPFKELPGSQALITQLRAGGFVLYLRHGQTDGSRPDVFPLAVPADCSKQRPLTEEGRDQARQLGEMLRKGAIPIAEVYASPFCRTSETARLAFGKFSVDELLVTTTNLTTEEKQPYLKELKRLLSLPVRDKGNRVIVTHAPNLADLIGYFPNPEGTMVVFQPMGNGSFNYIATIPPAAWPGLLHLK